MSRWLSLASSLFLDASAGTGYAFGVYSIQIQNHLDFTQSEIDLVGTMGNLGTYTCFLGGVLFDRYGPKASGIFGVVLSFLGYFLLWAGVSKHVAHTPFMIGLYQFIWSHGASALDITVVSATVRNFPMNVGAVVGLLKSFYGISGALVTRFYTSWYQPNAIKFLLFLTLFVTILGGVALIPVTIVTKRHTYPLTHLGFRRLRFGLAVVVVLALYLGFLGVLTAENVFKDSAVYTYIMIALILLPLFMIFPFKFWLDPAPSSNASLLRGVEGSAGSVSNAYVLPEDALDEDLSASLISPAAEDLDVCHVSGCTVTEAVCTIDFWLLFFVGVVWTGSGLMMINNVSQIAQALGAAPNGQDVYVTIISVANCFGRLFVGTFSDLFAAKLSRPMFFIIMLATLLLGLVIITVSDLSLLYLGCIFTAAAYGSYWCVMPAVVKERFGTRAFGAINSVLSLGAAIGSYFMAKELFSLVYQSHVPAHETKCLGRQCFWLSNVVSAVLTAVSLVVAIVIWYRMRSLYLLHDAKAAAVNMNAPHRTKSGAELAM